MKTDADIRMMYLIDIARLGECEHDRRTDGLPRDMRTTVHVGIIRVTALSGINLFFSYN